MKLNKDAASKAATKKAAPSGAALRIPSALEIASSKTTSKPPVSAPAKPAVKTAAIKETAPKTRKKSEMLTTVQAMVDVGFGNTLFIRGQGDGLSWDKGTPLECRDASTWVWSTKHASERVEFKLLINDEVWSSGENLTVSPGETIETSPLFN